MILNKTVIFQQLSQDSWRLGKSNDESNESDGCGQGKISKLKMDINSIRFSVDCAVKIFHFCAAP